MKAIDLQLLQECQAHGHAQRIPYVWDAKPDPSLRTDQITGSDCSGWLRYLLGRQGNELPEGSQEQMEWLKDQGLTESSDYPAVATGSGLWACFALDLRSEGGHPGHVWLLYQGQSMECCAGRGVTSRHWNTPVLRRSFLVAYRL